MPSWTGATCAFKKSLENSSSHKFHIGMLYFLHELKPCVLSSQWYLPTFYIGLEPTLIYIGLGPRLLSPMNWYYVSIQKNHKLSIQMAFFSFMSWSFMQFQVGIFHEASTTSVALKKLLSFMNWIHTCSQTFISFLQELIICGVSICF